MSAAPRQGTAQPKKAEGKFRQPLLELANLLGKLNSRGMRLPAVATEANKAIKMKDTRIATKVGLKWGGKNGRYGEDL